MIISHFCNRCGFSWSGKNYHELCGPCYKLGVKVISSGKKGKETMGTNSVNPSEPGPGPYSEGLAEMPATTK